MGATIGSTTTRASRATRSTRAEPDPRTRILDAALELFALHGLHGMSLQRLADQVGLHKSSLFHHFKGKDELALGCLKRVMEGIAPHVQELEFDDASDLDTIVHACEALADHFTAQPTAALFLTRALLGGQDRIDDGAGGQSRTDATVFFSVVSGWLERARRSGTIRPIRVRHALVNLMGLILFYPSIAGGFGKGLLGFDPTSTRASRARREELSALVRAALRPT